MSRIGKLPVGIDPKTQAKVEGRIITITGPLGELSFEFAPQVTVEVLESEIVVTKVDQTAGALWGTTRSIINNMMVGVTQGYKKGLEILGVGYKFELAGDKIILSIGFSHKVEMEVPTGIKAELDEKKKNIIYISGIDKQGVGEFSAKIRAQKKPEPYKGKGIRYIGEQVRRKAGKTGK